MVSPSQATEDVMRRTRPSRKTRKTEAEEARRAAGADRLPTDDEAKQAERHPLDPSVAEHEREMTERGAAQEGEGRIP
jgi:hypothetical protein